MCCRLVSCRRWPSPVETCRLLLHTVASFSLLLSSTSSLLFLGELKVIEHASRRRRCRSLCSRATTLKSEAESRQASASTGRAKGGGFSYAKPDNEYRLASHDSYSLPTLLSLNLGNTNTNSSLLFVPVPLFLSFSSLPLFFGSLVSGSTAVLRCV